MGLYGLTYTSFIAVEFAVYEVLDQWLHKFVGPQGLFNYLMESTRYTSAFR